ncbi:hypothetical protein PFICI_12952 [Pestalotiopsis fici W106-1]|uniref:Ecp2 effector protein domain-containing protein n=1 Tax=Pestalotiopsis fici (strain W106-1 / CGMCC3.15140) TaxID=1229662 RepID=W3WQ69_PESFW|nr:uncharacterized protein PFICI_12952 [Pestalotiopsis fici W106-1]ETS76008.1 hypothetical protein PFICI_12952 [Pestalotiopsis fici W106-1]
MYHALLSSLLLPLAAGLPPFLKEDMHPTSTEPLAQGQKWVELAQFDFDDYNLTGITLDCNRETMDENYQFHWYDPNYDETMDCNTTIEWDGVAIPQSLNSNPSTGFILCQPGNWWQFKLDVVRSLWDFNMTITKDHKDAQRFGTFLAQFFSYPNITMVKMGESDFRSVVYSTTGPVMAKIQGLVM